MIEAASHMLLIPARGVHNMDVCPVWLASTLDNKLRRCFHDPFRILGELIKEGCTAADIGCGPGYFTLPMAKMVGSSGSVLAVDVQKGMLDLLRRNAQKAGLKDRIFFHHCQPESLRIEEKVDFILAFWMVHEVANINSLFQDIASMLKPDGLFLMAEPKIHLSRKKFRMEVEAAVTAGMKAKEEIDVRLSRAVLFSL